MIVLAFDTCFGAVSAAVQAHGRVTGHFEICATGHAERLMPVVTMALADAGIAFRDVERLAVTLGPGGFTGLRVCISAARAFALALNVPVVGLSSLEVLARGAAKRGMAGRIVVATPAGRGYAYLQLFDCAPFAILGAPRLFGPDDQLNDRDEAFATATAVGPGAPLIAGRVAQVAEHTLDMQPDAAILAELAPALPPLVQVRPIYLRAADAKPQVGKGLARALDSRQT